MDRNNYIALVNSVANMFNNGQRHMGTSEQFTQKTCAYLYLWSNLAAWSTPSGGEVNNDCLVSRISQLHLESFLQHS